jgi:hypothetical protein
MSDQTATANASDAKVVAAFRVSEIRRQEFWREVAAWIVITITASALLAEHREHAHH